MDEPPAIPPGATGAARPPWIDWTLLWSGILVSGTNIMVTTEISDWFRRFYVNMGIKVHRFSATYYLLHWHVVFVLLAIAVLLAGLLAFFFTKGRRLRRLLVASFLLALFQLLLTILFIFVPLLADIDSAFANYRPQASPPSITVNHARD